MITYYDRSIRLWVAYKVDRYGNQIGSCGYGPTKRLAIADLEV